MYQSMSTTSVLLRFPKPVRRSSACDAAHQCGSHGETRCLLAVPFYFCFQVVQDSLLYKACASASPSVERMLCQIDRCEDKLLEFSDVTKCSHHEDVVSLLAECQRCAWGPRVCGNPSWGQKFLMWWACARLSLNRSRNCWRSTQSPFLLWALCCRRTIGICFGAWRL